MTTVYLDPGAAQRLAQDVFVDKGLGPDEARVVAAHLVGANLAGHDSHGFVRLVRYARWIDDGTIVPRTDGTPLMDCDTMLLVDAAHGAGQWVCERWIDVAVQRARRHGLALLAVRRAAHIGRVGRYAEMAADAGLVSMHWVNVAGSTLVAPFGGTERMLSTAPIAVGVPQPGGDHVLLDFATSLVAEGKLLVAAKKRQAMAFEALVGPAGEVSGDPALLYGETVHDEAPNNRAGPGAILPLGGLFGGHKGYGLAVMCELLGGLLTGTGVSLDAGKVRNGMLSILIDPARLDADGTFGAQVARFVDRLRVSHPMTAGQPVMVAGDPERRARIERNRDGFPMPATAWREIEALARQAGVPAADVQAAVIRTTG